MLVVNISTKRVVDLLQTLFSLHITALEDFVRLWIMSTGGYLLPPDYQDLLIAFRYFV